MLFLFLLCKIMAVVLCRTLYLEHKTDQCLRWGPSVGTEGEWNLTLFSHLFTSVTPSFLNLCVRTIRVKRKRPSKVTLLKMRSISQKSSRDRRHAQPGQARGILKNCGCGCGKAAGKQQVSCSGTTPKRRQAEGTASSVSGLSKQGGGGQGHPCHRTQTSAPLGV